MFEIDVNNFDLNLYRGVDIRKVLAVDTPFFSKLCACFYNDNKQKIGQLDFSGKTFSSVNHKMWASHQTDLNADGEKRIKEISLTTLYPCKLRVISDREEKVFEFEGNAKLQRKYANVKGKVFQFIFETDEASCDIKKPMIVFDAYEIL